VILSKRATRSPRAMFTEKGGVCAWVARLSKASSQSIDGVTRGVENEAARSVVHATALFAQLSK